jgi:hypothetical protein
MVWKQGVAFIELKSGLQRKPLARHRVDHVHFGGSRVHLIEAEGRACEQVAIFLDCALLAAGEYQHRDVNDLSHGRQIVFSQAQLHEQQYPILRNCAA